MANLGQIISRKTAADAQWKEQRQAEREGVSELRNAGIMEITSDPETYARYLDLQGRNPTYSAGNVAIVLFSLDGATQFGTRERWRSLGRTVLDSEMEKGAKIFARTDVGFSLTDTYDISQTQGKAVKEVCIREDTLHMEAALTTLLHYAPVPVEANEELGRPAYYDEAKQILYVDPRAKDNEAFPAIAAEIALARIHNKGFNRFYDRTESTLDAQSVAYILCKQFNIPCALPDTSDIAQNYEGWDVDQRAEALDAIHDMSKQIGRSIERSVGKDAAPIQKRGRSQPMRPAR